MGADRITRDADGRGVGAQAWNIYDRIGEIDALLRQSKPLQERVYESHPEVCFAALNGGRPPAHSMAYGESGTMAVGRIISRLAGPDKGPRLHGLSTATIRSVAMGVIGVALIQTLLLGIGFIWAGIPGAGVLALIVLLSGQVEDLYFSYRTTELRMGIARENAAIQKRSYEITQRLYRGGAQSELDLQQAKTQYLATLSTIPQLEQLLTNQRNGLCILLGRPPGPLPELDGGSNRLPSLETAIIQDIPARLLLRRPDVRAAAWQAAAQSAQIGISEADFYPAISLLGSIGWSATSLSGSPKSASLGVGPGLKWNLFDHGRIENNVRVQDARLQQLIESYRATVLQAAQEIDNAAVGVVKTHEQDAVLAESVTASQRALALATKLYREGYADFQRVLEAQRAAYAQAERRLVNQGSHVSAVIGLYKALGGGWLATPVDRIVPQQVRDGMRQRTDWGELLSAPLPDRPTNPPSASGESQHE